MVRELGERYSRLIRKKKEGEKMKEYIYPKNLKAKANLWLWGMKDFIILSCLVLLSIVLMVGVGWVAPVAVALCFAVLTIRKDEMTVLDYIKYATRYFVTDQQIYKWR